MLQVQLLEYQDTWPGQFSSVAEEIRSAIAVPSALIEHIGSTAVPGLCAKPVLDILVGVTSLAETEAAVPALFAAGFEYRPEYEHAIPDRRYFVRPPGMYLRVHLHAVVLGAALWNQHLQFRNHLREDAKLRESYSALKRELALAHATDKAAYTAAKAPFIQQVLLGL
jgi:GrpB-like predicted nucleotidyltransferase (UPF0157 family)